MYWHRTNTLFDLQTTPRRPHTKRENQSNQNEEKTESTREIIQYADSLAERVANKKQKAPNKGYEYTRVRNKYAKKLKRKEKEGEKRKADTNK